MRFNIYSVCRKQKQLVLLDKRSKLLYVSIVLRWVKSASEKA